MTNRDELVTACAKGDELTIKRHGYLELFEALRDGWWHRDPFTLRDFTHYMRFLGDYSPADVLAALPDVAGQWCPKPGVLLGAVRARARSQDEDQRPDVVRARNSAKTPDALTAVAAALAAGEHVCTCGAPSSRAWVPDRVVMRTDSHGKEFHIPIGVWRCPNCHGLEQGQAWEAEDQGYLGAVAA